MTFETPKKAMISSFDLKIPNAPMKNDEEESRNAMIVKIDDDVEDTASSPDIAVPQNATIVSADNDIEDTASSCNGVKKNLFTRFFRCMNV